MSAVNAWACACVALLLVAVAAAENGCVGLTDDEPTSCVQVLWRDCDKAFVASLVTPANAVTLQAPYIRESVLVPIEGGSDFSYCYTEADQQEETEYEACLNLTGIHEEDGNVTLCATVTVPEISQTVDYGCWSTKASGPGAAACGMAGYYNYPCNFHFQNVEETAVVEESHDEDQPWYINEDNCVVFSSEEVLACPTFYADTCGSSVHFSSSYGYFWMYPVDLDAPSAVDYTVNDNGCVYIFQLSNVATANDVEKLSVQLRVTADLSSVECHQTAEYPALEFGEVQYAFPACGESHDSCSSNGGGTMTWFFVSLGIMCLILLAFALVGALTLAMRLLAKQRKKPMYITDDEELSMQEEPGIFDDVDDDDEPEFDF